MALPTSGYLQASDINVELGRAWNHWFDMNGAAERNLAGKPSGVISFWDFYGKSNTIREPASGELYSVNDWDPRYYWGHNYSTVTIMWGSVVVNNDPPYNVSSRVIGTWTYYRGTYKAGDSDSAIYGIYRIGKY